MTRGQRGFSLLEIMVASAVGIMVMVGILYFYKAQHKNMVIQGGVADMRMNGQFTLNEVQYYLSNAGLGLPPGLDNIFVSGNDLVVRMNGTKKSAAASLAVSSARRAVFRIARQDADLFAGKAHAAAEKGGGAVEAPIESVVSSPGDPAHALITLRRAGRDFPPATELFPVERLRLHRTTGLRADTPGGEFRVVVDNPGGGRDIEMEKLTLAEGIESLSYRYFLNNRDSTSVLPDDLAQLQRIEIRVVARTLVKDRALRGDGYRRQTLTARVNYRRSL